MQRNGSPHYINNLQSRYHLSDKAAGLKAKLAIRLPNTSSI
jgi:hypothetical protein